MTFTMNVGNKQRHELDVHKDPLVSPRMINMNEYTDMHGRARYPLVKAHGESLRVWK